MRGDFVVSIARTAADEGDDFEFVPRLRSDVDEHYDAVESALSGVAGAVRQLPMPAGTLVLFEGRHSMHRVTPVRGTTARLVALLGYDTRPGTTSSRRLHFVRYGREA